MMIFFRIYIYACFLIVTASFANSGTERVDFLLDKLENARDFKVRIAAAEELGKISDGSVADWMLKAFKKESNAAVRFSILQGIARIPDANILSPLVSLTQEVTLSEGELLMIERTLWTFRKAIHLPNWEAVLVTTKNEKFRRTAAWLLGLSDKPYLLRSLYAAVKEPSPLLKQTVYKAISRLGQNKELNFCNSAKQSEKMASAIKAAEACAIFIKLKLADELPEQQTPYVVLNSEFSSLPEGTFSPQVFVQFLTKYRPEQKSENLSSDEVIEIVSHESPSREAHQLILEPEKVKKTTKMTGESMSDIGFYAQDVAVLKNALQGKNNEIDRCYKDRLTAEKKLRGDLIMAVTVLGDGSVKKIDYLKHSLTDVPLRSCVSRIIEKTTFPATGFKSVVVNYQFTFIPPTDQKMSFE